MLFAKSHLLGLLLLAACVAATALEAVRRAPRSLEHSLTLTAL